MKKMHVILLSVLTLILVSIIAVVVVKSNLEANLEKLAHLHISDVDLTRIENGIYTSRYSTFPVAAEVRVTIKDHKIAGINLVKHDNGQGKPAEAILEKVLEAQTLDVDIISGATYSSKVILKAIENALKSASK